MGTYCLMQITVLSRSHLCLINHRFHVNSTTIVLRVKTKIFRIVNIYIVFCEDSSQTKNENVITQHKTFAKYFSERIGLEQKIAFVTFTFCPQSSKNDEFSSK